ncbi:ribokinase [Thalassobacillus devorans]|uniref:ribokinase n=1 Tax=Thalassobacillus devorans TaxID=279813 RepID=UPI00048A4D41|nr:ribokinase [Thalassobacillus devorans]
MRRPKITVVGSINMDLTTTFDRMPQKGETLHGTSFATYPGGKGFNQAVAAARFGAEVSMIGAVGGDGFAQSLSLILAEEKISAAGVCSIKDMSTGTATILLTEGDNRIIVVPGANGRVTPEHIEEHRNLVIESDMVLLQLEIPMESVEKTSQIAYEAGVPIILNPAPSKQLSSKLLEKVTYVIPNEAEAADLIAGSTDLHDKLLITKGKQGVMFYSKEGTVQIPGYPVNPVDTTGAGDTFCGILSTCLARGDNLEEACKIANAGSALSVTKSGAQGGMPTEQAVLEFIREKES